MTNFIRIKKWQWRCVFTGFAALLLLAAASVFWHPYGVDVALLFRPYGLTSRAAWTTSRIHGTPDPLPRYALGPPLCAALPGIPVATRRWPLTDDLIALEESGRIYRIAAGKPPVLWMDLQDKVHFVTSSHGLWDIAFSPDFAKDHQIYLSYDTGTDEESRLVVMRYTLSETSQLASPLEIISWPGNGGHMGAALAFDRHGMLFVTVGDVGTSQGVGKSYEFGQDISDLHGKVLRIDVRGAHEGAPYTIPDGNPFVDLPGARPEIWALGLRNPWRMFMDATSGTLWVNDAGEDSWESVYKIERGANYGWSLTEGGHDFRPQGKKGPGTLVKPAVSHSHSECRALAGGLVYRGKRFPELTGHYLYGDYITGRIYAIPAEGSASPPELIADTRMHVIDLLEAPDGSIQVTTDKGEIRRIQHAETHEANAGFPRLLSETGLFRSIRNHQMEPGVVAYEVNAPLWSDGASKLRYVAIPNRGTASGGETFTYPDGTVFVKTFSVRLNESDPASEHHIETRLMHLENGVFHGYSYRWNETQDEAILVGADGDAFDLSIKRATGGDRTQTWKIPSRAQCFVCHTAASSFILGFTVPQLNQTKDYDGMHDNQLRALAHVGVIKGFWPRRYLGGGMVLAESNLPKYADPGDVHQPLEKRARAYVNINCGNCHRYLGGGNSAFSLDYEATGRSMTPAEVVPLHGAFGIEGARVLAPGDPDHSMIYRRMMMETAGRMPKLGVSVVDTQGAELVREWIKSLPATQRLTH